MDHILWKNRLSYAELHLLKIYEFLFCPEFYNPHSKYGIVKLIEMENE